jgi:hypothetical protein
MKKTYTVDTIMVTPLDGGKILDHVKKEIALGPNVDFGCHPDAIVANVFIDNECCFGELTKSLHNGKIQRVYFCPISIVTKTEGGMKIQSNAFSVTLGEDDIKKISLPPVSLKTFMGRRFGYNPRIEKNTREFVKLYNEAAQDETDGE